jgi:hypothetical protein
MTAADDRQIAGQRNRVGLHYSRFRLLHRSAPKQIQQFALMKKFKPPESADESAKIA